MKQRRVDPECNAIEWLRTRLAKRREQLEDGCESKSVVELEAEIVELERAIGELSFARFAARTAT
jgi:ABC-type phosphate transport system auxiliary subunit